MSQFIEINGRRIGPGTSVYVVAELSANHGQRIEDAMALLHAAKECGADAVKLQTYTPDTITLNVRTDPFIVQGESQPESWKNKTLYELYESAYTPWEWHRELQDVARNLGLVLFSTPFDDSAVDFLEQLEVPCYKIASYEAIHIPLLKRVARTGKPVILSTGFASLEELQVAVTTLRDHSEGGLALLHCITSYSSSPQLQYANLGTIPDLSERFNVVSGFSDNNGGVQLPVLAALVAKASIVEKHLTLDRDAGGPDALFSLEPAQFKRMVNLIRKGERVGAQTALSDIQLSPQEIVLAMGQPHFGGASAQEEENKRLRPSIWAKTDIRRGEALTESNIRVARPSGGLPPRCFEEVQSRKAKSDMAPGTPITWDVID